MEQQSDNRIMSPSTESLIKAYYGEDATTNTSSIHHLKKILVIIFSIITIGISILAAGLTYYKSSQLLKDKVSSLISEITVQMRMNVENYLKNIENTSTLIFSDSAIYDYDAANTTMDEYDALTVEDHISSTLYNLCIMENYVDFGIVYSNNHSVGKLSNGTKTLFGDNLYADLSSFIKNESTFDGWSSGYNDDFKRIYYVKRVNEGSIFVASFYASELEDVFKHPTNIGNISVRFTNSDYSIVYSSESGEIGTKLDDTIISDIDGETNATILNSKTLTTINIANSDWYVVCTIPTSDLMKEQNQLLFFVLSVIIVCAILAIGSTVILSNKIANPVNNMVNHLNKKALTDQLTGILNKKSFEQIVSHSISEASAGTNFAFVLIDIDDFKHVNDTLGHAQGDIVLANVGKLLRDNFRNQDVLGRIGGDEFAVLLRLPGDKLENQMNLIDFKCKAVCTAFRSTYAGADSTYKISASLGISIAPFNGNNFQELYEAADKALYMSKRKGKDTFTIFSKGE